MKCPLAHSSVGVDVGLAVRTGVGYIFQIVDHTRNETAAQVTSHKAAEAAEQEIHEPDLVGNVSSDWLLAVRAHCLYWRTLEHLALQYGHRGGGGRSSAGSGWHDDSGGGVGTGGWELGWILSSCRWVVPHRSIGSRRRVKTRVWGNVSWVCLIWRRSRFWGCEGKAGWIGRWSLSVIFHAGGAMLVL